MNDILRVKALQDMVQQISGIRTLLLTGIASIVNVAPFTFANLPTQPIFGMMAAVTDSTTNTWGAVISGGGSFNVLAWYNGTAWTVTGK